MSSSSATAATATTTTTTTDVALPPFLSDLDTAAAGKNGLAEQTLLVTTHPDGMSIVDDGNTSLMIRAPSTCNWHNERAELYRLRTGDSFFFNRTQVASSLKSSID